ncbi:MAG TPA: YcgL domain-containing protein [Halieaceae bacterium]|nr:MAG: hypothetical protein DRQ98_02055 [Gammaproteobacteria bacterium]HDY83310.1 YcgL domain-containing protein [Halieaceae bacterium]
MKLLCQVFKSPRKQEMYLYVDKARGLVDVPEVLMSQFGEPQAVMTLILDPQRKLARVDTAEVLVNITEKGYFLQMPPTAAQLLRRDGSGG